MRKLKALLFISVIAVIIAGYTMQAFMPKKAISLEPPLREVLPGVHFEKTGGSLPLYRSEQGSVAFNSHDIAPDIKGYAGPIQVLVVMGPDGKISRIKILDHRETRNYVHYMESPAYLERFAGKSVHDPLEIDRDIDGISRATVSVQALARTVRESSRSVAAEVFGIRVRETAGKTPFAWGWTAYLILFLSALIFYYLSRSDRRLLKARDVFLAGGIGVIGVYLSAPFSVLHVFNLLLLQPSSSILWATIVMTTLFSTVIAGRFYCGWLCPFGAIAELIGRLPARKWGLSIHADDAGREMKYIILAVVVMIVFTSRRPEFGNYETYVTLFSLHGSYLSWLMVGIMLVANLRVRRFWCRYLCPVAALTGLLSRKDPGYVSSPDCPMGNKPMPLISECIRCNRCYTNRQ